MSPSTPHRVAAARLRTALRTVDVAYGRPGSGKHRVAGRVLAVLAAVAVLGACGDGGGAPGSAVGATVFAERCAACHGADGSGAVGPPLTAEVITERFPDPDDQEAVVRAGVEGRMPAFGDVLSDAEIEAVVRYTREEL